MQVPLQVTFRHMEPFEGLEELIREKVAKLDDLPGNLLGCRVVVEPAGKHREHGHQYEVRLDITVPGEEIVVTRTPSQRDVRTAIGDAFDAARRRLDDYVRCRRGLVKTLEAAPHARVSKLIPEQDHGFLATSDGREIYFHRHSVVNERFEQLQLGTEVTFVEAAGTKGPQASTVKLVGKHGGL